MTTTDDIDNAFDGQTSLREALAYANSNPDKNTITFASSLNTTPIVLSKGELTVSTSLELVGNGAANTIIDGNNTSRIFTINDGIAIMQAEVAITGVTLQHGSAISSYGGAIWIRENLTLTNSTVANNSAYFGGGVYVLGGSATLTNSTVANNTAEYDGGGVYIFNGKLALTNSTVTVNTAPLGGGVYVNGGQVAVTNSTIAGNTVEYDGGGVNVSYGTLALTNSTIAGNTAGRDGGGVFVGGGSLELGNMLVVGNKAPNDPEVLGTYVNLLGSSRIGLNGLSLDKIVQVDANNKPLLADNGGPTQTIALVPGSPAIGKAVAALAPAADQRGLARNVNPDIGAFETQVPTVTVSAANVTYNGSPQGATGVTVGGPYGSLPGTAGTIAYAYTNTATNQTQADAPVNAGNHTVVATFTPTIAGYRTGTSAPVSFTIGRAAATVSVTSGDVVYSGSAYPAAGTVAGLSGPGFTLEGVGLTFGYVGKSGDAKLSGSLSPTAPVNVGQYSVVASFAGSANYLPAEAKKNFSITPATVTVLADANPNTAAPDPFSQVYGNAGPVLTFTSSGLAAGNAFTGSLGRTEGKDVGKYAVTKGTLSAGSNYVIDFTGVDYAITPRPLTVTASAGDRVYNGLTAATAVQLSDDRLPGDVLTVSYNSATFADGHAGTNKPVTVGGLTLSGTTNYQLAGDTATTTATITPRTASWTTNAAGKIYGDADPVPLTTGSGTGFLALDGVTATYGRATGSTVGPYALTATLASSRLTAAQLAQNYGITNAGAAFTITPRPVTVTADPKTKIAGTADPALTFQITSGNLVAGDGYTPILTRASGDTAGSYAITLSNLAAASNYQLTYVGANFVITPASMILTTSRTVVVPGLAVTFTATTTGLTSGTMTFRDGTTVLGTAPVVNGVAQLTTTELGVYGNRTITATYAGPATVPAGSVVVSVVTAAILPDAVTGQTALFVGGTAQDDEIEVKAMGNDRYDVEVEWAAGEFEQVFTGAVARVVIYGMAGNDEIDAKGNIRVPVYEFGGLGNDELHGAENAPNVLVGGAGTDKLTGGNAPDILIGGAGADRLEAKGSDDMLIGGSTAFDADEIALWGVQLEWTSDRSFTTRMANLRGTGTGPRANGSTFLQTTGSGATVFNDNSADVLKGGSGRNWYFAKTKGSGVLDTVSGLQSDDWLDELP